MIKTQEQISQSLQELSDASFHLIKFAEQSHVPDALGARITELADLMCILGEDLNAGFNELMDADILSMLQGN